MYCPQCGREVVDGAAFCGACGHRFESAPVAAPVPPGRAGRPETAARLLVGGAAALFGAGAVVAAAQAIGSYAPFKEEIALLDVGAVMLGATLYYLMGLILVGCMLAAAVGAARLVSTHARTVKHPVGQAAAPACVVLVVTAAVLVFHATTGIWGDVASAPVVAVASACNAYGLWLRWGCVLVILAFGVLVAGLVRRRAATRHQAAGAPPVQGTPTGSR